MDLDFQISCPKQTYLMWSSRRSPIYSTSGICASSQPVASSCGAKILEAGGTAAGIEIPVNMLSCVIKHY